MVIQNLSKNTVLADKCQIAKSFAARFKGLMGKNKFEFSCGLLIVPCNSIHMFFMKFPIDVVFLNKANIVVHIIEGLNPWKLSKIVWTANSVLELPVETVKKSGTQVGDKLQVV